MYLSYPFSSVPFHLCYLSYWWSTQLWTRSRRNRNAWSNMGTLQVRTLATWIWPLMDGGRCARTLLRMEVFGWLFGPERIISTLNPMEPHRSLPCLSLSLPLFCLCQMYGYRQEQEQTILHFFLTATSFTTHFLSSLPFAHTIKHNRYKNFQLPGPEKYAHEQLSFISYSRRFCIKETPEFAKSMVQLDIHSPAKWRINS